MTEGEGALRPSLFNKNFRWQSKIKNQAMFIGVIVKLEV
jgi:hypothetical protein